jgi:hypothetical protein
MLVLEPPRGVAQVGRVVGGTGIGAGGQDDMVVDLGGFVR